MLEAILTSCVQIGLWGPTTTPAPPPAPELPSYGSLLVRTLIALAIVIVLVWVALRYGLGRLSGARAAGGPLRLLARRSLDGRRSVVLLEAAGRTFLLGVAEGQVSLLAELEAEAVSATTQALETSSGRRFADVLRRHLRPKADEERPSVEVEAKAKAGAAGAGAAAGGGGSGNGDAGGGNQDKDEGDQG